MIGCSVAPACALACLFGESSQQPTCPHVRQMRRCSQTSPLSEAVLAAGDLLRQLGDLDLVRVGAACHFLPFASRGSQTWNTVPSEPVSNASEPPWRCSTIRRAVSSPMPVPLPGGLVVKNGSKTR